MAGYIGKAKSVSLTSGYTTDQADAEFVNDPNEVITVSGSNVGIGTATPNKSIEIYDSANTQLRVRNGSNDAQSYDLGRNGSDGIFQIYGNQTGFTGYSFGGVDGERMRIDSSGRVTVPFQPSFQVGISASGTVDATGDDDVLSDRFDDVFHNTGSHYNASNGRFTAPVDGVYFVASTVRWETKDFTQDNYIRLYIGKNGGTFASTDIAGINGINEAWNRYMAMSVSGVVYLEANDYIELKGGMTGGTAKLHTESSFSGHLLG